MFIYLKNFMGLFYPKVLKSLNFGGPVWGGTVIVAPQFLLGLVYFQYLPIPKIWSI